ncbi:MAG: prepilin peptidase [Candidatus Taylorbacteria bacterium]
MFTSALVPILFFVFGSIIGSFLNVVALRYNTGLSLNGRSACFSCGKTLKWYELFPIFSFLFQRGKCRGCKSKISSQYPIVETVTGLVFLSTYFKFFSDFSFSSSFALLVTRYTLQVTSLVFFLVVFCLLIVIAIYDIHHKIIPNGLVYAFIALSFLKLFFFSSSLTLHVTSYMFPSLLELLAGPILFLPFFLLWFLSRGKWMGFGDGKLALGLGWLLGLPQGTTAVMIAFYSGAFVGLGLIAYKHVARRFKSRSFALNKNTNHLTMKSEIPFGPFLIFGIFVVFFFSVNFFPFYMSLL